ncbi:MAG TPA: hypothetical protein VK574_12770 [Terracidiphilus sp.]|nr:hypothetical protein [Terracidiphilus sp.]
MRGAAGDRANPHAATHCDALTEFFRSSFAFQLIYQCAQDDCAQKSVGSSADTDARQAQNAKLRKRILENLNALIVNLTPHARIGNITESTEIDCRDEIATRSSENHNLVVSILRNPIKGFDEFGMIRRAKGERTTFGMKFGDQHSVCVSGQPQTAVGMTPNRHAHDSNSRLHLAYANVGAVVNGLSSDLRRSISR